MCLSSLVIVSQAASEDVLASLRELEDVLSEASTLERPEAQALSSSLHQEALYYLNMYGTHLALVSFHMRHEHLAEALTHLLSKVRGSRATPGVALRDLGPEHETQYIKGLK